MATMTWVGLDVHARSIEAAAVDVRSGELLHRRFGGESEPVVAWLTGLAAPVSACYEAGPTDYGLYRAATAAGVGMQVVAPSKTPRGPGDRVKTDRKDAELLVRLLAAGALTPISVPLPAFAAARDLSRAREAALDEQLSRLAEDPLFWPTVARRRCFRGLDTLGALVVHLEVPSAAVFQPRNE